MRHLRVAVCLAVTALCLGFATIGQSAVITVSSYGAVGDHLTIQAAYNASSAGDTIVVGPGDYDASISIHRRLTILGAGYDLTTNRSFTFESGSTGSVLEGFWCVNGGNAIHLHEAADSIYIRRCRLASNYAAWDVFGRDGGGNGMHLWLEDCEIINMTSDGDGLTCYYDTVIVRNCVFAHVNGGYSSGHAIVGYPNYLDVINCTFLGYYDLLGLSGNAPFLFMNNIVYDWSSNGDWGDYPVGSVFAYNASSDRLPPGTDAILLEENPFVDYDESGIYLPGVSDLHLNDTTLCIDAGNPAILDKASGTVI